MSQAGPARSRTISTGTTFGFCRVEHSRTSTSPTASLPRRRSRGLPRRDTPLSTRTIRSVQLGRNVAVDRRCCGFPRIDHLRHRCHVWRPQYVPAGRAGSRRHLQCGALSLHGYVGQLELSGRTASGRDHRVHLFQSFLLHVDQWPMPAGCYIRRRELSGDADSAADDTVHLGELVACRTDLPTMTRGGLQPATIGSTHP